MRARDTTFLHRIRMYSATDPVPPFDTDDVEAFTYQTVRGVLAQGKHRENRENREKREWRRSLHTYQLAGRRETSNACTYDDDALAPVRLGLLLGVHILAASAAVFLLTTVTVSAILPRPCPGPCSTVVVAVLVVIIVIVTLAVVLAFLLLVKVELVLSYTGV